jgi:ATP-dependent helicase/nuclease subunit A
MSDLPNPIAACSPEINAIVAASAGTGKTYLLVTRIIRQLLAGMPAERILALTFTRKAAGEMRQRLRERLRSMATLDDVRLRGTLIEMGLDGSAAELERARRLYEQILLSPRPLRISTFHAFCQQLLQRFPLEADVPPGYELLQAGSILQTAAWDALFLEATRNPDGAMAQALEALFIACIGSQDSIHQALVQGFLARRNDWLAYTQEQENPVDYACERLRQLLQLDGSDPLVDFFSDENSGRLRIFRDLLVRHITPTNAEHATLIEQALRTENPPLRFEHLKRAFLTQKLEPRQRKNSKVLEKALGGSDRVTEFLELHESFCAQLLNTQESLLRSNYWKTADSWYRVGDALLQHYQRLKQEQRLLDFDDLEWKTYQLLHHRDHSLWVQYKIDQKIDHLLIDEFQDTNPTQWRLILPLLEEMADGKSAERRRSIFLVGDGKQSIYGFRRADPRLQEAAGDWLRLHLDAREFSLAKSRRSADAIMQTINHVFQDTAIAGNLHGFEPHASHRSELWGWVEVMQCMEQPQPDPANPEIPAAAGLRDPLTIARTQSEAGIRYLEGRNIARRIQEILNNGYSIEKSTGGHGPVDYDDIFILFRTRTHIAAYEQALTDHAIPFTSLEKGSLLEQQEVEDIEALLNVLLTPFNNLALAQVLKSPIFGADDLDLLRLSQLEGDWYGRLKTHAEGPPADKSPPLLRAWNLLSAWRALLPALPLHDLMDRIFHEGDLIARYRSATPQPLANRVISNLQKLLALALEIDSGRYPSLSNFLLRLKRIRATQQDQPDTPPLTGDSKVRLMTIHAAKGLEAPVVFVADACTGSIRADSYYALVDWPHTADRPEHLLLYTTKSLMPAIMGPILERQRQRQLREQANLLYVALSRAKQMLFISGSRNNSGNRDESESVDWYRNIVQALQLHAAPLPNGGYLLTNGEVRQSPQSRHPGIPAQNPAPEIPLLHTRPVATAIAPGDIAEDKAGPGDSPEHQLLSRQHGTVVHKMLEMLSTPDSLPAVEINTFLDFGVTRAHLKAWETEVMAVLTKAELKFLFDPELYDKAYKEVPLVYRTAEGETVYGIIDRVVIHNNEVWVIDYKTRDASDTRPMQQLLQRYRSQLLYYAEGLRKIWPDKAMRPAILLTGTQSLYMIE